MTSTAPTGRSDDRRDVDRLFARFSLGASLLTAILLTAVLFAAPLTESAISETVKKLVQNNSILRGPAGPEGRDGREGPQGPRGREGPPGSPAAPIGAVVAWPSTTRIPAGWHICDGSVLSTSRGETTPELIATLWATYQGTQPNTAAGEVRLPDFRGCFLRGAGTVHDGNKPVPIHKAEQLGKRQPSAVGPHKHRTGMNTDKNQEGAFGTAPNPDRLSVGAAAAWDPHRFALTDHPQNHGGETRPVNYAIHWIIRVK